MSSQHESAAGPREGESGEAEAPLRLLVVDDDDLVVRAVARTLGRDGFDVAVAHDVDEAWERFEAHDPDVCVLDVGLPGGHSGLDLLLAFRRHDPTVECVVFTGDGDATVAVDAFERGAIEYFDKPIGDWKRFRSALRQAGRIRRLTRERDALRDGSEGRGDDLHHRLVGASRPMEDLRWTLRRLAPRSTTALFLGPTGVGKTWVAECLHDLSGRRGPFEVVNCGALDGPTMNSELFGHERGAFTGADSRHLGAFERAAGGTILLDEIGDLPLELQAKLLQVLDTRRFQRLGGHRVLHCEARILAATHRDLESQVRAGRFRADLLNRLGVRVHVAPLNERREDIPRLVYTFLRQVNRREGTAVRRVPGAVMDRLVEHDWSDGNLRGLRTAVEQMAVFSGGDVLSIDVAPAFVSGSGEPPGQVVADGAGSGEVDGVVPAWWDLPYAAFKERLLHDGVARYLRRRLDAADGNVTRAAEAAGVHRPNLRRLMRRHGVEATPAKDGSSRDRGG